MTHSQHPRLKQAPEAQPLSAPSPQPRVYPGAGAGGTTNRICRRGDRAQMAGAPLPVAEDIVRAADAPLNSAAFGMRPPKPRREGRNGSRSPATARRRPRRSG